MSPPAASLDRQFGRRARIEYILKLVFEANICAIWIADLADPPDAEGGVLSTSCQRRGQELKSALERLFSRPKLASDTWDS
jgi:hypothetical protein